MIYSIKLTCIRSHGTSCVTVFQSVRQMASKKEKAKKPRPEELAFLLNFARGRLRLGELHLREAELLIKRNDTPNACAHAAYYAMHHCAAAALYLEGKTGKSGMVVESHEHVLQHYAKLVEGEIAPLSETAEWLNQARALRVKADYGMVNGGATREDAHESWVNAVMFFKLFHERWTLDMPADEMENLSLTHKLKKQTKE